MKKYIVSGLPPSNNSGVGILLNNLLPEAARQSFNILTRRDNPSIEKYIKERKYLHAFYEYVARIIDNIIFSIKISFITDAVVLIIHQQSVGYKNVFKLIKRNKIYIYIMDNSFFCIKSYNYDPILKKECFRCYTDFDLILEECCPANSKAAAVGLITDLELLRSHASGITFLAQNELQRSLLQQFYGPSVACKVVGLDTGEINTIPGHSQRGMGFDFVFHGSLSLAKGIGYVIDLAAELKEFTFLIPLAIEKAERFFNRTEFPGNITFRSSSWGTGLMEEVMKARFVLNPSTWSAPVEGALIKSLFYNGNVITIASEYAYEKEVAGSYPLLRVPANDITSASAMIREAIDNGFTVEPVKLAGWIDLFKEKNKVKNVFEAIVA